jgi:O-methyltransferase / aklanonic acid methyltransferase
VRPKQSVAGLFGRAAAAYDRVGFFHQVARRLLSLAGVGHGMRVLDLACGAGAVLVPAARLVGPAGLAVGIDLAEPMAAVAASKLQRLGQSRGVVAVMDAEQLGLRAGRFDVVCCASAIYLLVDQAAAVRGWLEMLRPGGTLAVSEFGDLDARWGWKDELLGRLGPLERMDAAALAAYRAAACTAIEACREADGRLHWRPEVIYVVTSR